MMETKKPWLSSKLLVSILIALSFGLMLYIRISPPYPAIFVGDWIKFSSNDAYYQMRLVENLVHNFPSLMSFDPYLVFPNGGAVGNVHFFNWLLAAAIWVIGLGSPTQHTIEVVSVYYPAVLAALTAIPVYFTGKALFGRGAGILATLLIAILPGEFLGRSILGFTDQHVAETLFSTVALMFLVLAIKTAKERQLTFNHIRHRDSATYTKPVIYSLLGGFFLGIYLLTWLGALLFVSIICLYFAIQFIIDHLRHRSSDYLCVIGTIVFFIALIMFLPVSLRTFYLLALIVATLVPAVLSSLSWGMRRFNIKPVAYPFTVIGLALAGLAILRIIVPTLFVTGASFFFPTGASITTLEMQSIFPPGVNLFNTPAWGNFSTSLILSFIAIVIMGYRVIKDGDTELTFMLVWTVVILAAMLGQRRFAYYFVINVALLGGYMSWLILRAAGFGKQAPQPVEIVQTKKKKRKIEKPKDIPSGGLYLTGRQAVMALALVSIFLLTYFPNIRPAFLTAKQALFAPNDAWYESLYWLKANSPEPFGNPDFYYQLPEPPKPGETYKYPETAYGVMAWWDYGYWITYVAHRIPNANPSQDPRAIKPVAGFFTSQNETAADEIANKLGSSYIIIDDATSGGKFWAIAMWAGKDVTEFFDTYMVPQGNQLMPVRLFYPEYYRSLSTRLYNFDTKAAAASHIIVISYVDKRTKQGQGYKEITSAEKFNTYEDATAYISSQTSGNFRIVSDNPFQSPVPLEELKNYQLVFSSEQKAAQPIVGEVSLVKVFQYTGGDTPN